MEGKIDAGDKAKLESMIKETLEWLDHNQLAEEEEFEDKKKALESVASPIFTKLYQGGGGGGMDDKMPGAAPASGPTVEEVD
jgi:L1 cell adhesion molecule like protein